MRQIVSAGSTVKKESSSSEESSDEEVTIKKPNSNPNANSQSNGKKSSSSSDSDSDDEPPAKKLNVDEKAENSNNKRKRESSSSESSGNYTRGHMSICLHTLLLKYNNDFLDRQSSGKGKGGIVKLLQWKAYDFPQLVSDMIFYCKSEYLVSSDNKNFPNLQAVWEGPTGRANLLIKRGAFFPIHSETWTNFYGCKKISSKFESFPRSSIFLGIGSVMYLLNNIIFSF